MKIFKSLPVLFALIWILIKLIMYTFNIPSQEKIGVFINLFMLLITGLAALHFKVVKEKKLEDYGTNFKFVLKNMGIYIILVTLYIFVHYKFINPNYLQSKEDARVEQELSKDYELIQKNTPMLKEVSKEEYEERVRGAAEALSSISMNVSIYFLGLFIMSILYGIFVPIFYKKVVLRM